MSSLIILKAKNSMKQKLIFSFDQIKHFLPLIKYCKQIVKNFFSPIVLRSKSEGKNKNVQEISMSGSRCHILLNLHSFGIQWPYFSDIFLMIIWPSLLTRLCHIIYFLLCTKNSLLHSAFKCPLMQIISILFMY